jgi:hypothetical protein
MEGHERFVIHRPRLGLVFESKNPNFQLSFTTLNKLKHFIIIIKF